MTRADGLELAAVCDLDEERLSKTAKRYDVPSSYTDPDEALEREDPDHVSAVLPPAQNLPVVKDILVHEPDSLIIEKPVGPTLHRAEALEEVAADVKTDLTVCHQHIYLDEAQALKQWIENGRIGDPQRVLVTSVGGPLGMGTHLMHMTNWLLDESPRTVSGHSEGAIRIGYHQPSDATLEVGYDTARDLRAYFRLGSDVQDVPEHEGKSWLDARIDVIGTEGHAEFVLSDHATLTSAPGGPETV